MNGPSDISINFNPSLFQETSPHVFLIFASCWLWKEGYAFAAENIVIDKDGKPDWLSIHFNAVNAVCIRSREDNAAKDMWIIGNKT